MLHLAGDADAQVHLRRQHHAGHADVGLSRHPVHAFGQRTRATALAAQLRGHVAHELQVGFFGEPAASGHHHAGCCEVHVALRQILRSRHAQGASRGGEGGFLDGVGARSGGLVEHAGTHRVDGRAVGLALALAHAAEVHGGGQVAFELDDVGDGRRAQMGGQPAGQNLHGTGGLDQDDARSLGVHDGVHAGVRVVDGVSGGNVDMHGLVGHAGQSLDAGGDQHHFVGHAAGAGAQGAGGGGGFSDNACFHVHITFPTGPL